MSRLPWIPRCGKLSVCVSRTAPAEVQAPSRVGLERWDGRTKPGGGSQRAGITMRNCWRQASTRPPDKRWNPKMKRYIYGGRNGIYSLTCTDTQTVRGRAHICPEVAANGEIVLFVGPRSRLRTAVEEARSAAGCSTSTSLARGMLTNFRSHSAADNRLRELRRWRRKASLRS